MLRINDGEYAFTEKKSKFLAFGYGISGRADVKTHVDALRAKYPDATHVCYGFIADGTGDDYGYDDDGEPSGTAGKPIWSAIASSGAVRSLIAVVRYFGGVKLGAGGLVRAYSGCTAENLAVARIAEFQVCAESMLSCDYPLADALLRGITEQGASVVRVEYSDRVNAVVAVKKSEEEKFLNGIINRLNGRLEVNKIREYYFPFEI